MQKIEKILVNSNECFLINKYKILGIYVYKFVQVNGEIIFAIKRKNQYYKIKNDFFLTQIKKKFIYNPTTDISEYSDEK